MTNLKQEITTKLMQCVSDLGVNTEGLEPELARPTDEKFGDYTTNIALRLSKELGKNPREVAQEIVDSLSVLLSDVKLEIAGPGFINFTLLPTAGLARLQEFLKGSYGFEKDYAGRTVLIEHTSPNPNKAMHLGHLKNNVTGLAISYLIEALGAKVYRDAIDNNRGIAIAKLMWGYLKFARKDGAEDKADLEYWFTHQDEWHTPETAEKDPGLFVDSLYTQASGVMKSNPEVEAQVRQLVIDWEAENQHNWALWNLTQEWVWQGYEKALKRVDGYKFDKIWHEHEIYKKGKEHVYRGLEEGLFQKLEDGAILTNLGPQFGLPDTILIKRDGTALYITQDLELTYLKKQTFHADEMCWVIGPEQSLAMQQMFAVCSQLGFGRYEDFHHLAYGFILIKDKEGKAKKMSSREGTQIYVNALIDQAKEEIRKLITSDEIVDADALAEKVAVGAIKYSLLKVTRTQDIAFDFKETISLEGNSGPYLLYTLARARSILRTANLHFETVPSGIELHDMELDLVKWLERYPETVVKAAEGYAPNYLCDYLFELAQRYNRFYNKLSILNSNSETEKQSRVWLSAIFAKVLHDGLNLLGIESVERM